MCVGVIYKEQSSAGTIFSIFMWYTFVCCANEYILRGELSGIHHFWFIKHIAGAEACHFGDSVPHWVLFMPSRQVVLSHLLVRMRRNKWTE